MARHVSFTLKWNYHGELEGYTVQLNTVLIHYVSDDTSVKYKIKVRTAGNGSKCKSRILVRVYFSHLDILLIFLSSQFLSLLAGLKGNYPQSKGFKAQVIVCVEVLWCRSPSSVIFFDPFLMLNCLTVMLQKMCFFKSERC